MIYDRKEIQWQKSKLQKSHFKKTRKDLNVRFENSSITYA